MVERALVRCQSEIESVTNPADPLTAVKNLVAAFTG